jgi:hypothetical protein
LEAANDFLFEINVTNEDVTPVTLQLPFILPVPGQ